MPKSLVVVESPAKAKTINKFLGSDYLVKACMGHVRDLPEDELGIDLKNGFKPKYVIVKGKRKILRELKEAAKEASPIFLATDPDREGEAIAWHVAHEIAKDRPDVHRILFNEITEGTVRKAMESPLPIDLKRVNAQQARRILDRLVGYKVSPFLWKTVYSGLSAGRVQSVALRLICEREDELSSFKPREYWVVWATLRGSSGEPFRAKLVRIGGKKASISSGEDAHRITSELRGEIFRVSSIDKTPKKKFPAPPFITSTLQQEASRRFKFSPKRTMSLAQQLYEGVELEGGSVGLITYMRTDSVRIASEALDAVRRYIATSYGTDYLPPKPRVYRSKKGAQEAHEAIRPTSLSYEPRKLKRYLTPDQMKLYELIWNRFLACQMKPMELEVTTVNIKAGDCIFQATGSTVLFRGFSAVYIEREDEEPGEAEEVIPPGLEVGGALELIELVPEQRFTKPPPRYTEATLIKELESKGIGRPSTYSQIVGTIQERKYVEKEKGRLVPTELGMTVNNILVSYFPDLFNVKFTAKMEENLDRIESGDVDWLGVVRDFYSSFSETLSRANSQRGAIRESLQEKTDIVCEKCGSPMVIRWGKNGRFLACSAFPRCKNTRPLPGEEEPSGERCEICGAEMVIREGPYGRFLACSAYPKCKNTRPLTLGIPCPMEGCDGEIVERRTKRGRTFYGCSRYPDCDFSTWDRPVGKSCPSCGFKLLTERVSKDGTVTLRCPSCKEEFRDEDE